MTNWGLQTLAIIIVDLNNESSQYVTILCGGGGFQIF